MNINQELVNNILALCTVIFDKPYTYQQDFLLSESKRIAFRSGRQVGKTTMCAIKALYKALKHEKQVVVILSPTQRQSSLMFRKVRAYSKNELIIDLIESESQTRISFKNGSEIHCLPGNNPDTIRGYSPNLLIIDEAAFVKDDVYVSSEPSLAATNGQLILVSTPFGKRGRFYMSFFEDEFEKYHIQSIESPLITQEFLDGQKGSKTELEYKQEFEGEFLEELDTYFPRQLVLDSIAEIADGIKPQRDYYLGVDCARYGTDETVYVITEVWQNKAQVLEIISTSKKPLTDVIGRVKDLHKKYGFRGIYMDSSGLGSGAVDSLLGSGLPIKNLLTTTGKYADSVQFTLQNKEEIYKNLKLMMEQGRLFYPNHEKLIFQLCDLQYEFTEAGHLKLHHPERGHDDFPDALALAVAAIITPEYTPYIAV